MRLACKKLLLLVLFASTLCIVSPRDGLAQRKAQPNLFEFHSGFWINLHHFLYRQAQLSVPQRGRSPLSLTKADADELPKLSLAERAAWNDALSYYSQFVVKRDLLFDDELIQTKDRLEDAGASPDLARVDISAGLKTALLKAAPIYREHWWPLHNVQNQEWIAKLEPMVARYGPALSAQLTRIYDEPWPQYPVRVDTVAYANWAGAYTTLRPTRPTISTTDPANQGTAAMEILFHETSHGMTDKVMEAINSAEAEVNARRRGTDFHTGSLWHAVLFYTAGELVTEQVPGYTPYADKNGLWVRAWPAPDRSLMEQDWKPYINGLVTLQQALTKLVNDVASSTQTH